MFGELRDAVSTIPDLGPPPTGPCLNKSFTSSEFPSSFLTTLISLFLFISLLDLALYLDTSSPSALLTPAP